MDIGEALQGWVYWTWKARVFFSLSNTQSSSVLNRLPSLISFSQAENADEWSYQKGMEGGWIPQDPTERLYPGLCDNANN